MGVASRRERRSYAVIGILAAALAAVLVVLLWSYVESTPALPAQVVSVTPVGTVSNLSSDVVVRFDRAMDRQSVEAAFSMSDGKAPVMGAFYWSEYDSVLTFQPSAPLSYGRDYTVTVGSGARSDAGEPITRGFSWTFHTTSASRALASLLEFAAIPVVFLLMLFVALETAAHRAWRRMMEARYGEDFAEGGHDFKPLFSRRERPERGLILEKGTWGAIYENGISAHFTFGRHKSVRNEFVPFGEIEAIYPLSSGVKYSRSKTRVYDGLQIETKDLKVCILSSPRHPVKDIMPALVNQMGARWEKVYIASKPLEPAELGAHHWKPGDGEKGGPKAGDEG